MCCKDYTGLKPDEINGQNMRRISGEQFCSPNGGKWWPNSGECKRGPSRILTDQEIEEMQWSQSIAEVGTAWRCANKILGIGGSCTDYEEFEIDCKNGGCTHLDVCVSQTVMDDDDNTVEECLKVL